MDPADEGGLQPQRAGAGDGVGDRPAWRLMAFLHRGIEHFGPVRFDQLHDALLDPHMGQEVVIVLRDHVDDGIADADELIGLGHSVLSS